jgi:hypothetical protein
MHSLWHSLEFILPACLVGMLLSGFGIVICYAIVYVRRRKEAELPASVQFISRWSVKLAWFSFACFWLTLLVCFALSVANMAMHPEHD